MKYYIMSCHLTWDRGKLESFLYLVYRVDDWINPVSWIIWVYNLPWAKKRQSFLSLVDASLGWLNPVSWIVWLYDLWTERLAHPVLLDLVTGISYVENFMISSLTDLYAG